MDALSKQRNVLNDHSKLASQVVENLEAFADPNYYHFPGARPEKYDADRQLGGPGKMQHSAGRAEIPGITRMPQTEEEAVRNRAHTQMTSNMIKNSLKEMREKLQTMRHNKEMVALGLKQLDADFINN